MKRTILMAGCVALFAAACLAASGQAQQLFGKSDKIRPSLTPLELALQKQQHLSDLDITKKLPPDMAVEEFHGVLQGSSYFLGVRVRNPGGVPAPERMLRLSVLPSFGAPVTLRTVPVPALQPSETRDFLFEVATREVPFSTVTARFFVALSAGDDNPRNDTADTWVTPVVH